jgi:short-subunit dehydrogenase
VETELKNDPSISMFVNNAGTGSVAPMLDANIETVVAEKEVRLVCLLFSTPPFD